MAIAPISGNPAPVKRWVHRACDLLEQLVRVSVVGLTIVMLLALSFQILMRYAFGNALSWSEELAVTCFSWSMLLAIATGVRNAIHVRMDLLADNLPAPIGWALDKLVHLAIAFTGIFLAWSGASYVRESADVVSAAIGYPIRLLYLCAPVSGVLMAVFALERVFIGAVGSDVDPAMPVIPSSPATDGVTSRAASTSTQTG
ncbi:MAG: TRAP transporter small permease [Comamonadaceae bacterium]|nr:MAG: TRAP transporter small permease [Comamonadaceae bacterium]